MTTSESSLSRVETHLYPVYSSFQCIVCVRRSITAYSGRGGSSPQETLP